MPSSAIWPRFVDGGGGDSQRCYKTGEVFWARQGLFWPQYTVFCVGGRSVNGSNRGFLASFGGSDGWLCWCWGLVMWWWSVVVVVGGR